jgi:hypothetical protein
VIKLERQSQRLVDNDAVVAAPIADLVSDVQASRLSISRTCSSQRDTLPDFTAKFQGIMIVGRRSSLSAKDPELIRRQYDELFGVTVRKYDCLMEAAVTLS